MIEQQSGVFQQQYYSNGEPVSDPASRPWLISENRATFELSELYRSPVYYGIDVPRGDKSPVLTIPGYLGYDSYLSIMNTWLRRLGYTPYASQVWNWQQNPRDIFNHIEDRVDAIAQHTGEPVHVIGHSAGGLFARGAAARHPENFAHLITLGSPLVTNMRLAAHRLVTSHGEITMRNPLAARPNAQQRAMQQETFFNSLVSDPIDPAVRVSSVYSRGDAIVDWRACIDASPQTRAIEVHGSHTGLAYNAQVYRHLAEALATRV